MLKKLSLGAVLTLALVPLTPYAFAQQKAGSTMQTANPDADRNGATAIPVQAAADATAPPSCAGQGVDPAALIRYRTEAVIKAPLSTVWRLQTDVESWPSWQPSVATVKRLDAGPLQDGSQFQWETPVPATTLSPATTLTIVSTVLDMQPQSCIRWSGPANGKGLRIDNGVHVWTFSEVEGGVLVTTEETWTGAQVEADVGFSSAVLGAGLDAWLRDLKAAAEGNI